MISPQNLGIEMDQGADFNLVIGVLGQSGPINLTGYQFKGQMAVSTDSAVAPVAAFNFTILNQALYPGQVQMSLPASATSALITSTSNSLQKQRLATPYVFDVEMLDTNNTASRIIQGIIYVSPQATQEAFP